MLRIGDFARLARVTIKALRHYDEAGLLRPAHVDRTTGYRYYRPEQLDALNRILLLRDLGFALSDIARLVDAPDLLDAALDRRRAALVDTLAQDRARLRRLDAYRDALAANPAPPPVIPRGVPAVRAVTARAVTAPGDGTITELFETLEVTAKRLRARADASPFLLFHDIRGDETMDVEACVPVDRDGDGVRLVAGHALAGTVAYRGPYAQTPSLFAELARWVSASDGTIAGPLREVYHRFGADQRGYRLPPRMLAADAADYLTELQIPITPSPEPRP